MENLEELDDFQLLELLSHGKQSEAVDNQIKKILRARKVEFVDFDKSKSSDNFNLAKVGSVLAIIAFLVFKLVRYFGT